MSRNGQGGTKKWCPKCKQITVCSAIKPSQLGKRSGQRWYKSEHPDINWFRRGLVCRSCSHGWLTAEVKEDFLDELVELRDALKKIKQHAEQYAEESKQASPSLENLSASLKVLKALKIYKQQK
jgi:hypothetical protein